MFALSAVPVIGWILAALLSFLGAIPMYYLWNWAAPIYFTFLPAVWLAIPFWHVVGLVWLLLCLKSFFVSSPYVDVTTKK